MHNIKSINQRIKDKMLFDIISCFEQEKRNTLTKYDILVCNNSCNVFKRVEIKIHYHSIYKK